MFCCLQHDVEAFCHKQDSLMRGAAAFVDRERRTTHKCYNLYFTVEMLTSSAEIDAKARHWSKIAIFPQFWGFSLEYCHNVWYGKTRMMWLPDGGKKLKICSFISTEYTNMTDRQTDGQTDGWTDSARQRLCRASCCKN